MTRLEEKNERHRLKQRLLAEVSKEAWKIAIGSIAMVISTISNQGISIVLTFMVMNKI
jgi:hypothetical protein